jgi:hypothetical protein
MLWNLERSATPSPQNSRSQCCGLEPSGVADLLRVSDPLRVWTGCFAAVLLLAICCSSQLCEPSFELAVRTIKCEVLSRDTATDTSSSKHCAPECNFSRLPPPQPLICNTKDPQQHQVVSVTCSHRSKVHAQDHPECCGYGPWLLLDCCDVAFIERIMYQ